jgi:hypothetical protein
MGATTHLNRRGLIESAVVALQSERVGITAERSGMESAEAIHRLGGVSTVALMAFAESRVISNMLRLARAELTMAEEGLRVGETGLARRALDNAEAWFAAALASCPHDGQDDQGGSIH